MLKVYTIRLHIYIGIRKFEFMAKTKFLCNLWINVGFLHPYIQEVGTRNVISSYLLFEEGYRPHLQGYLKTQTTQTAHTL